jgi:hypothetical protein
MLHCELAIARPARSPALQTPGTAGTPVWEFHTSHAGGGVHLPPPQAASDWNRALFWSVASDDAGAAAHTLDICEASLRGAGPAAQAARLQFPSQVYPGAAAIAALHGAADEAAAVFVLTADATLHRVSVPSDRRGRAAPHAIDTGAIRTTSLEAYAQQLGTPTSTAAVADGTVVIGGTGGALLAVPPATFSEGGRLHCKRRRETVCIAWSALYWWTIRVSQMWTNKAADVSSSGLHHTPQC